MPSVEEGVARPDGGSPRSHDHVEPDTDDSHDPQSNPPNDQHEQPAQSPTTSGQSVSPNDVPDTRTHDPPLTELRQLAPIEDPTAHHPDGAGSELQSAGSVLDYAGPGPDCVGDMPDSIQGDAGPMPDYAVSESDELKATLDCADSAGSGMEHAGLASNFAGSEPDYVASAEPDYIPAGTVCDGSTGAATNRTDTNSAGLVSDSVGSVLGGLPDSVHSSSLQRAAQTQSGASPASVPDDDSFVTDNDLASVPEVCGQTCSDDVASDASESSSAMADGAGTVLSNTDCELAGNDGAVPEVERPPIGGDDEDDDDDKNVHENAESDPENSGCHFDNPVTRYENTGSDYENTGNDCENNGRDQKHETPESGHENTGSGGEMAGNGCVQSESGGGGCEDFASLLLERCLGPLAAGTTRTTEGLEVLRSELIKQEQCCRQQRAEINRLTEEKERLRRQTIAGGTSVTTSACDGQDADGQACDEATADIYEVQMAALEKTITQLQRESDMYRLKMTEHDAAARDTIAAVKKELLARLDKVGKQLKATEKEKDGMVVNYAQSEKTVLSLRKVLDEQERKLKENVREREMMQGKIRSLNNERARLAQAVDTKSSELNGSQRECDKLKEEISSKDIKIKWAQNKLKTETDAHKDSLGKLDKLQQKLKETREEADQVRRDCQEMIRTYQESEEIKSNSLDLQLREKETELELERQEKCDQEEVYQRLKGELDAIKRKHKLSIDENNGLTVKLQCLERERLDYEQNLGKLKEQLNASLQEIVDLHAKLAEMDNVTAQVSRERDRVAVGQSEIERLRQANAELQIDMEACRGKEGELLEFTERLTGKNVALQSEFSCLEAKFQEQEREIKSSRKLIDELEQQNEALVGQCQDEEQQRKQETQLLARKLAEKTKTIENLNLKLDEQNNDIQVLKRKNAASVRELSREVQTLNRRLESYEASRPRYGGENTGGANGLGSRNSSNGSLDRLAVNTVNGTPPRKSVSVQEMTSSSADRSSGVDASSSAATPVQPSHQMLIERIVKLQRAHARKNEKLEFLDEHVNQLLHELKKKTKIIQCYVMREEAGSMSTVSMDQNKAEVSRRGGIMASLYMSEQADESMTMELSLEISRKLQAVLEDTLLKNITLKENIKTLGEEIERLAYTRQRQHVN